MCYEPEEQGRSDLRRMCVGSPFQQVGLLWLRDPEEHLGGTWGLPGELGRWMAPALPCDPALSAPGLASSAPRRHRSPALPRPLPLADRAPRHGARAMGPAGCSPQPPTRRKGLGPLLPDAASPHMLL